MTKRHFLELGEDLVHVVQRVRALRMARDLRHLPRAEVGVDVLGQLLALAGQTLDLVGDVDRRFVLHVAQFIDLRFQFGDRLLELEPEALKGVGLSARKVEYLGDLARHFSDGAVHVGQWHGMDDEAIIEELVAIRGIGRWTAEMFLIFHLLRPNVLPLDDPGLIRGISENYFSGEPVSRAEARELGDGWSPYRSVATWYLWRSLDPMTVGN